MKNIHNEYNNLYYWSNDFVQMKIQGKNSSKVEKDRSKVGKNGKEDEMNKICQDK